MGVRQSSQREKRQLLKCGQDTPGASQCRCIRTSKFPGQLLVEKKVLGHAYAHVRLDVSSRLDPVSSSFPVVDVPTTSGNIPEDFAWKGIILINLPDILDHT